MKFDVPKKVIEKLFENGYEDQIVDIVMDFSEDNSREVSDIPISPTMMQDSGKRIIISDKVYQAYQKMINKISNPDTAQEIPYFLLGNIKNIEGEECIFIENIEFCNQESLDDLRVSIDVDRFKNLLSNSPYEVISIGHTHGNVSEDKKNLSLARNLSNDIIQKYETSTYTSTETEEDGYSYVYFFTKGEKDEHYQIQVGIKNYYPTEDNTQDLIKQIKVRVFYVTGNDVKDIDIGTTVQNT